VTYTVLALAGAGCAVAVDLGVTGVRLIARRAFWTSYAIVLGFQLVVNGLLAGLPVVRYRPSAIVGVRFAYAPVEDLLFGFALVLLTLTVWVWLGRRATHDAASPRAAAAPRRARPTERRRENTS
jgi:lycopene cyclase domain-containing protein